jgi:hypothetical protein
LPKSVSSFVDVIVVKRVVGEIAGDIITSSVISYSFTVGAESESTISPCQNILCFSGELVFKYISAIVNG